MDIFPKIMNKYLPYLKKKRIWIPLAFLAAIILYFALRTKASPATSTAPVVRGSITEAVFVTGSVKSEDTVGLAFEKAGRVAGVNVIVGQHVSRGATLASLDSGSEYAGVQSAKAKLSAEQARLAELQKGARPEEVALAQTDLANAKQQLADSYGDIGTTLQSAENAADNAVTGLLDPVFTRTDPANPKFSFTVNNQQLQAQGETGRADAGALIAAMKADIAALPADDASALAVLKNNGDRLASIQSFLSIVAAAIDQSVNVSASNLALYKSNVASARSGVTAALQSLRALVQSIGSEAIAVQKAQNALTLKQVPSTPEAIAIQQSAVDQAEAAIISAQAAYYKDFLTAPVSGTVTAKNILPGEISSPNAPAISMQGDGQFQIEADIPEADIAKIKVGDSATTTLDAYGSDAEFAAAVIAVDPAERIVEGVATYKVTLSFSKPDPRIRSGMTANLAIVTDSRADALSIPQRAVIDSDGKKTVRVLSADGKTIEERAVTTGIRGENGEIEILSGLNEGETVVTFVKA